MSTTCKCYENFSFSEQQYYCLVDYYDGPVSGVVTCPHCQWHYSFDMLDWTADQRYRLFMIYKIDITCYERIKELATGFRNEFGIESESYELIKKIIHPKSKPDMLIVWDIANDLLFTTSSVPNSYTYDAFVAWNDTINETNWFSLLTITLPR